VLETIRNADLNESLAESAPLSDEGAAQSNALRLSIERVINENKGIVDVFALREKVLKLTGGTAPVTFQLRNRQEHLRGLAKFFRAVLDPNSANPRMRSFVRNVALARQFGLRPRDLRELPRVFDRRFNDPDDLITPIFEIIFQDRQAGLLRQWMRELDAYVEASSRAMVRAIDTAARKGLPPLRRDVVLVGGGPLTSIIASVLAPYFHVTVITAQRGIGKPWRHRPIFINSSSARADFNGAGLPLLKGTTTRVVGSQMLNSLDSNVLLGNDTKTVVCDDGFIAE